MVKITDGAVDLLRERVKGYLTEKRYAHTLAVEAKAVELAEMYLPEKTAEIRAAALLHDITKKWDDAKQLQYSADFGIIINTHETVQTKTLHAKTAAELVMHDFPDYATSDVVSGVRYHTTGHAGMTVFEAIIYLADFIEETRTFADCVALRNYYKDNISSAVTEADKKRVLVDTMIKSFDLTLLGLIDGGEYIDTLSSEARNYFIAVREGRMNMERYNG